MKGFSTCRYPLPAISTGEPSNFACVLAMGIWHVAHLVSMTDVNFGFLVTSHATFSFHNESFEAFAIIVERQWESIETSALDWS
jgi:hypothetical protein